MLSPTIQNNMEESIRTLKQAITNELRAKSYSEKINNLKALSEAELFETCNRRENLRIFCLPEETTQSLDGKRLSESYDQTINKLVNLACEMGAAVDKNDISIAHRLPSKGNGNRPVIVRFSRRVGKIDLLKKKKTLTKKQFERVSVYEDLTKARLHFLQILIQDARIESSCSREGTLFNKWMADQKVYRGTGLFDGGSFLQYPAESVWNCFFPNTFHQPLATSKVRAKPELCWFFCVQFVAIQHSFSSYTLWKPRSTNNLPQK